MSVERIKEIFKNDGVLASSMPYWEERKGQIDMASEVFLAVRQKKSAIIEAGCGTGKTLAYLVPLALQHFRAVISTGTRALQEQLYYKDIPVLKEHIRTGLKAVYIKGRSNYLCLYRLDSAKQYSLFDSPEYMKQFESIVEWSETTTTGDSAELKTVSEFSEAWKDVNCTSDTCLGYVCPYYSDCFLMKLKREAKKAHIIVVNHHLFFADLMMKNNGGRSVLPPYKAVVFDEAHLLEDIVTRFLGKKFGSRGIRDFIKQGRLIAKEFLYDDKNTLSLFLNLLQECEQQSEKLFSKIPPRKGRYPISHLDDILPELVEISEPLVETFNMLYGVSKETCSIYSDEFIGYADRCILLKNDLIFITQQTDTNYVHWFEVTRRHVTFNSSPIDVSELFRSSVLKRCKTVVFTSATLSTADSFEYVAKRLGIDDDHIELIVESPFDYAAQGQLYMPTNLPIPGQKTFVDKFSKLTYEILCKTNGRAFCLFTSYRNMSQVCEYIRSQDFPHTIIQQGELSRSQILEKFREDTHSVLFATNTYWQGIDVSGEALSCVIIDKLPFAVPTDPIVHSRMEYITKNGGDAFSEYQVPMAVIAMRQGIGRLIRSRKDRGLIVLGDKRLLRRRYGKIFLDSFPPFSRITNINDILIQREND